MWPRTSTDAKLHWPGQLVNFAFWFQVQTVLLEERGGQSSFQYESYSLKWLFSNEFDLVRALVEAG